MKEFPFGAAFFMPTEGIAEDLVNMKTANMNVARLEWIKNAVWEAIECSPGVYTFDAIDEAMEAAVAAEMKMMLQIGIHPPRWARDKYGGVGVVNDHGLMSYPKEKYSICYDNPDIIKLAEKYIRTMVRRYKDHPALYGWISWNEPHLSNGDVTCYCPHTTKAFRSWLQEKYGRLSILNEAWKEGYPTYTKWDEVDPPRQKPRGRGIYQAWQDWRAFMDENFADLIRRVTSIIREEDVSHPTKVNLLIPVVNTTITCSDVWHMADTADEVGVSLFVEINEGDFPQLISQSADLIRSANSYHGTRFWLDEIQGGPNFVSHGRVVLPPDRLISLYPWQAIAHGAKGFTYWMWRPLGGGLEAGEFGLVGRDGSLRPRTAEAQKVGELIQKHSDLLLSAEPENEVCILHSPAIFHMCYGEGLDTHIGSVPLDTPPERSRYTSAIMGAYTILWEEKFGVDFINPGHLVDSGLAKYKVLLMPFPYLLEEPAASRIRDYVESGGLVISEFPNIMKDEAGKMHKVCPGAGLHEVFGFEDTDVAQTSSRRIILGDQTEILTGPVRQLVETLPDSSILGRFSDGNPAVVFHKFGQGGILSFCAEVFQPVLWNDHRALASLIKQFLSVYGVCGAGELRGIDADLARRVQISELAVPDGSRIVIIANHNAEPVSGVVSLSQYARCIDLMSDQELALVRGELSLNLEEHGVLALHVIE